MDYQNQDSQQTLREGLEEYYAAFPNLDRFDESDRRMDLPGNKFGRRNPTDNPGDSTINPKRPNLFLDDFYHCQSIYGT